MEKVTRVRTQCARLENGNFYLPSEAPWLADFRRECHAFPNGQNDDMVGTMAQFLDWLGMRKGRQAIEELNRRRQRRR